ncbi:YdcF family protein [Aidingimonas lacisalsi]|uniref:YdcF family protein n=1 Tax=Aidingimonas lacisalsi TaxID=2604086 RepID=UPI00191C6929
MTWLKYLALPPLANVCLTLLGMALWRVHHGLGGSLAALALGSLLLLSTPIGSHWVRSGLETYSPPDDEIIASAQAIVILGGGRDYRAAEFDWGDAPANPTWRRLAYGALLARHAELPILVSGGRPHGETLSEATLMANALNDAFGLTATWQEGDSHNTIENAINSAALLEENNIERILLVTQAWHMPRAVAAFERTSLTVIPAPTDMASPPPKGPSGWLPRAYFLRQSTQALHEWLGLLVNDVQGR